MKNTVRALAVAFVICVFFAMAIAVSASEAVTILDEGYVMKTNSDGTENTDGSENDVYYKVTSDNVLTITATNSTELLIDPTDWNDAQLEAAIPWFKEYRTQITKVVVAFPVTKIDGYVFDGLSSCVSIEFPDNKIQLSGSMIFANMAALTTLGTSGDLEEGVIDLRNFTGSSSQAFENSCKGIITVLMPYTTSSPISEGKVFHNNTDVTFTVIKGSPCETTAKNIKTKAESAENPSPYADDVEIKYYSEGAITGKVEGMYAWSLDLATMHLTVTNEYEDKSLWEELGVKDAAFQSFKASWNPYILTMEVEYFEKIYHQTSGYNLCQGMSSLVSVKFAEGQRIGSARYNISNDSIIGGYGLFEGCTALSSVTFGGTLKTGVADLSGMSCNSGDAPEAYTADLFNGCENIVEVIFPKSAVYDDIHYTCFVDCTALKRVTIPETITSVDEGAFDSCGALTVKLTGTANQLTADSFPAGSTVIAENMSGINRGVTFDGWKLRIADYNGLRGVFCFDNAVANTGYTLVEYGALVVPAESRDSIYVTVSDDTATANIYNFYPVYSTDAEGNGSITGKILNGDDVKNKNNTYFAISIVKYSDQYYNNELYMAGYEVWKTVDGSYIVIMTDYGIDAEHNTNYIDASIYEISLGMYKAGAINAELDTGSIVWNTLKAGGGVILNIGDHYTLTDYFTTDEDTVYDMKTGEAFGNSFEAVEIPMVWQIKKDIDGVQTLTFEDAGVTYTLLKDVNENEGKYVIVYRDNQDKSGTAIPNTNLYGVGFNSQLAGNWYLTDTVKANVSAVSMTRPNPLLNGAIYNNVKYAIIDHGITASSGETFSGSGAETYVYASTYKSMGKGAFQSTTYITTMFSAGGDMIEGRVELSGLDFVGDSYTFNGSERIVELHLPVNVGVSTQFCQNTSSLTTLWLGDAEPQTGVINLSNATNTAFTSIGSKAFTKIAAEKIIIPATVVEIKSDAFSASSGAFEIIQIIDEEVEAIRTYADGKGYTYTVIETLDDWSGIVID